MDEHRFDDDGGAIYDSDLGDYMTFIHICSNDGFVIAVPIHVIARLRDRMDGLTIARTEAATLIQLPGAFVVKG